MRLINCRKLLQIPLSKKSMIIKFSWGMEDNFSIIKIVHNLTLLNIVSGEPLLFLFGFDGTILTNKTAVWSTKECKAPHSA
mmetsp:Transcript_18629/g.24454  ORF Transcript_18629/g.24454 Transcript_18629/m.24454 type:complete len:81 (-) Transcript_18629:485-727(-)